MGIVSPGSIKVTNNYIRDVNTISNGGGDWGNCCDTGIYMDVLSGVLVSGNVVTGSHSSCFNLHGGNDEILNNVCDVGTGAMNIVAYTVADARNNPTMAGNSFHNNIVTAAINGGGNGFRADNDGGTAIAMNIHDNLYFNYVGASVNSNGNPRQGQPGDSNPVYANPMISGWLVGMFPASTAMVSPINFPCLPGGWGPPGFVLPQDFGSLPNWPLILRENRLCRRIDPFRNLFHLRALMRSDVLQEHSERRNVKNGYDIYVPDAPKWIAPKISVQLARTTDD